MERARRHGRVSRVVDVVILPGEQSAVRFAGRAFNLSRGGLAFFSSHFFPSGARLAVELTIPMEGEGLRRVVLYGVTRWVRMEGNGAVMGVEWLKDAQSGDYAWFAEHFDLCVGPHGCRGGTADPKRSGGEE